MTNFWFVVTWGTAMFQFFGPFYTDSECLKMRDIVIEELHPTSFSPCLVGPIPTDIDLMEIEEEPTHGNP